ncbi:MAG: hypothetical protein K0M56_02145 [Kaistella sp.]|nr:hypothetical protein [Kaistella sp.]
MNFKYYNRTKLVIFILVLSVALGKIMPYVEQYINKFETMKQINDFIGVFSVVGLLGLILWIVDTIGWKYKIFTWLVDVPNLNGRYVGSLVSSHNGSTKMDCTIEIVQTASLIKMYSYFGNINERSVSSESLSHTEEIICEPNGLHKLIYTFKNNSDIEVTLNDHEGAGSLAYFDDIKKLEGIYFNRRGNTGKIEVVFQQKKLLKRFI